MNQVQGIERGGESGDGQGGSQCPQVDSLRPHCPLSASIRISLSSVRVGLRTRMSQVSVSQGLNLIKVGVSRIRPRVARLLQDPPETSEAIDLSCCQKAGSF